MPDVIREIIISEKEFTETDYEGLKRALVYIKKSLIDSDGNMNLAVDSIVEIDNIITGSNNTISRNVNVKPYELNKV